MKDTRPVSCSGSPSCCAAVTNVVRSIHEKTGITKGNVKFYLRELTNTGWIHRYTRGLHEFVTDPREPTSD